jgi:hypothetical protein
MIVYYKRLDNTNMFLLLLWIIPIFFISSLPILAIWICSLVGYEKGDILDTSEDMLNYYQHYEPSNSISITRIDKPALSRLNAIRHSTELIKSDVVNGEKLFPLVALPIIVYGMIMDFWRGRTVFTSPVLTPLIQQGGARAAPLSTESQLLGVTIAAILGGGATKALIDYFVNVQ